MEVRSRKRRSQPGAAESRGVRDCSGGAAPMSWRRDELTVLAALAHTRARAGVRLSVLTGRAGTGKTTVVRALLDVLPSHARLPVA